MSSTLPPIHINQKTVQKNLFSKHDNRHAFQSSGVYFGQGLGKRLVGERRSQHHSENHISWSSPLSYSSTYRAGYYNSHIHTCTDKPSVHSTLRADRAQLRKFQGGTKSSFRRFPRNHPLVDDPKDTQLVTDTAKCFVAGTDGSFTTPLSVLAATQQPFLTHNPWTFSYKQ